MQDYEKEPTHNNPKQWSYNHDWVIEAITTALSALVGLSLIVGIVYLSWVD
jgi:hypothetical protein